MTKDKKERLMQMTIPIYTDNILYCPRNNYVFNYLDKDNEPCVTIRIICFPACCGIGMVQIEKINTWDEIDDLFQEMLIQTNYKTFFIVPQNKNIEDNLKKGKYKYLKQLNVYQVCRL